MSESYEGKGKGTNQKMRVAEAMGVGEKW